MCSCELPRVMYRSHYKTVNCLYFVKENLYNKSGNYIKLYA